MGIETRIGIVTGLVIVVIASVYFFYGNNSDKDQFVIATGSKVGDKAKTTEPPKIPPSADRGKPGSPSPATKPPVVVNKTPAPAPAKPAPVQPQIVAAQPPRPATPSDKPAIGGSSPVAAAPRSTSPVVQGPPAPIEPRHQEGLAPRLAKADEPRTDLGTGSTRSPLASPLEDAKVTPLRTGPSQSLVDATKQNIEKAQNPPTTSGPASSTTPTKTAESPKRTPIVLADPSKAEARPVTATPVRPAVPAAGAASSQRQHKIANGDTLAVISQKYFGDAHHVSEILAANPQVKDPRRLKVGDQLVIPATTDAPKTGGTPEIKLVADTSSVAKVGESAKQPSGTGKTYQVKEGDTFYGIAKALLGDGTRWHEIYELNKTMLKNDPKRLKPGMTLNLPG